jgi:hypothetical protein
VPLTETDVGERLHVTGLVAPDGDVVTAQVSATVPENEFVGVTVIVEVPLALALTLMVPLLVRVKSELTGFQKPLQPTSSSGAASANPVHFFNLIAAPPQRAQFYKKSDLPSLHSE